jgi:hypothetical protein
LLLALLAFYLASTVADQGYGVTLFTVAFLSRPKIQFPLSVLDSNFALDYADQSMAMQA